MIEVSNIPLQNLRREFEEHLALFRTPEFRKAVFECHLRPVKLHNLQWHGLPNDLLTFMLQRAVLGLESYLPAAVEYELFKRAPLTDKDKCTLQNPFTLSRQTVIAFYEELPALAEKSFALSKYDDTLFAWVQQFYKRVRNPLFHGGQVAFSGTNYDAVVRAFEMLALVYDWLDSWKGMFGSGWQDLRATLSASQSK